MNIILDILIMLMDLYWWVIVGSVVLSWLMVFGVINANHPYVRSLWQLFYSFTEPLQKPIRRMLPDTGAIDVSPLFLLIGLSILRHIVVSIRIGAI